MSKAARLREARKKLPDKLISPVVSDASGSFLQNSKKEDHGTREYRAFRELSGSPETERGNAKEIARWLSGDVASLKACPLLWFTSRSWVCLLCADVLDMPSKARVHAMGHIDPVRLPTNPPRGKRSIRHLDPVRTSGYIVTGPHRKHRGTLPAALVELAEVKLREYTGWNWYPPPPKQAPYDDDAPGIFEPTPVPRWDADEVIELKPDPTEPPERRRLIDRARARNAAGVPYQIDPKYRALFPD